MNDRVEKKADDTPQVNASIWQPLKRPLFRALWIASFLSMAGSWMQDIAAAWQMTSIAPSPVMVAMVQSAMTLPLFLLAVPAGALADILDRRHCLIFAQSWMMISALLLGILTITGHANASILLLLVFSIGIGAALGLPTFAATLPDLVPRNELLAAITLNGLAGNATRAIGPAVAGILLSWIDPAVIYLMNAATYIGLIAVFYFWRSHQHEKTLPSERFLGALRVGIRFTRQSPELQKVMLCGLLFFFSAISILALLPLYVRHEMGGGPAMLGGLMGFYGSGAVIAALAGSRLANIMSRERLVLCCFLAFACSIILLALVRNIYVMAPVMLVAGGAWLTVMASLQIAAQLALPAWVRARGLAVFLTVVMGSLAGGAALWGYIANHTSMSTSLMIAAGLLAISALLIRRISISDHEDANLSPLENWPDPSIAMPIEGDRGPILITVQYDVPDEQARDFLADMKKVRRMRLRNGAASWSLFRDATDPDHFTEFFLIESWIEYLRQRRRVTVADRTLIRHLRTYHMHESPPSVTRLIAEQLPQKGEKGPVPSRVGDTAKPPLN